MTPRAVVQPAQDTQWQHQHYIVECCHDVHGLQQQPVRKEC
jgi:hypothetical protein